MTLIKIIKLATLWAIIKKTLESEKVPLTRNLPLIILAVIQQPTKIWWKWKPWKGVLTKKMKGKRVILLTLSKTESKMQFWPQSIVTLLLKSICHLGQKRVFSTGCEQCHGDFRKRGTHRDYCFFWKRIRKDFYTLFVYYEWFDSSYYSGWGKWIVPGTLFDRQPQQHNHWHCQLQFKSPFSILKGWIYKGST